MPEGFQSANMPRGIASKPALIPDAAKTFLSRGGLIGGLALVSILTTAAGAFANTIVNPPVVTTEPTFSESTTNGVSSYLYGVSSSGGPITTIIIPEVNPNNFLLTGETLPSSGGPWTLTQQTTSLSNQIKFDDGGPVGAEMILSTTGVGSNTVDFTLLSDISSTMHATWSFGNINGTVTFDPPVPNPEPASITLLAVGAFGAFGAARRRRLQVLVSAGAAAA